jgi:hypothetical protein
MIDRRARAASYAIICRIGPVLRHEISGLMQPVRMLLTVLERRMLKPDFDRDAIAENISTVCALSKHATIGCMNSFDWFAELSDKSVNLKASVDELKQLLAIEFSERALTIVNAIETDALTIRQSIVRTALVGALLAFCDEQTAQGELRISFDEQLLVRYVPYTDSDAKIVGEANLESGIDWLDVEALAASANVTMSRGNGWLRLNISE